MLLFESPNCPAGFLSPLFWSCCFIGIDNNNLENLRILCVALNLINCFSVDFFFVRKIQILKLGKGSNHFVFFFLPSLMPYVFESWSISFIFLEILVLSHIFFFFEKKQKNISKNISKTFLRWRYTIKINILSIFENCKQVFGGVHNPGSKCRNLRKLYLMKDRDAATISPHYSKATLYIFGVFPITTSNRNKGFTAQHLLHWDHMYWDPN